MLITAVVIASLPAALGIAPPAWACDCDRPDLEHQLEQSDAVFSGTVTGIDAGDGRAYDTGGAVATYDTDSRIRLLEVDVEVDQVWDGEVDEHQLLYTEESSGSCGYEFEQGRAYLLYTAEDDEARLRASLCSRIAPIGDAAEDLDALGEGGPPLAAPAPTTEVRTPEPTQAPAQSPQAPERSASTPDRPAPTPEQPTRASWWFAALVGGGGLLLVGLAATTRRRTR